MAESVPESRTFYISERSVFRNGARPVICMVYTFFSVFCPNAGRARRGKGMEDWEMRRIWTVLLCILISAGICSCAPSAGSGAAETPVPAQSKGPQADTEPEAPDAGASAGRTAIPLRWIMPTDSTMHEMSVKADDGRTIFGIAYIPQTKEEKVPLVIWSHGLGGTGLDGASYAGVFAGHGVACYCFDFCGGGADSRSSGEMTDMSVLTEVSDLEAVLEAAKEWDFVDPERIILAGQSQGGLVSAITAARKPDETAGLILLYPAFVIPQTVHDLFPSLSAVPETYQYNWITAGKKYAQDIWELDVWEAIKGYEKPVLLLHGDADDIVDVSWSRRARDVYRNARMYVFPGAGHRFIGDDFDDACDDIFEYLQETGLLKPEVYWRPRRSTSASPAN